MFVVAAGLTMSSCSDDDDDDVVVGNPDPDPVPTITWVDCIEPTAPGSQTTCGFLTVPENREDPNSNMIDLYFARIPAPDQTTATPPLIFLTGGPGATTQTAWELFENPNQIGALDVYRNTFGDNRDIIILDQRGTNQSIPSLYCSQELAAGIPSAYSMPYADAVTMRLGFLEECRERFINEGIDLNGYNTVENATDVNDLVQALDLDKVVLFGASYGTRLVMITMELFPDIVESAVIDSILPPEVNPFPAQAGGTAYALGNFWTQTKADFPNLEQVFYETISRLEAQPKPYTVNWTDSSGNTQTTTVTVTGTVYADYVIGGLRATPYNKDLPLSMMQAYQTQDYSAIAQDWTGSIGFLFPTTGPGTGADAFGMFECVNAANNGYYTTPEQVTQKIQGFLTTESIQNWATQNFIRINADVLGLWPVTPLPPSIMYPLESDLPTLMLVGSLDSATPEVFSWPSSRFLPNSYYFEILAGHAVTVDPCAAELMNNFIKNPSVVPEDPCNNTPEWTTSSSKEGLVQEEKPPVQYDGHRFHITEK